MNNLAPYTFTLGEHHHKKVIFIQFNHNKDLIAEVESLVGSSWSHSKRMWYVPDVSEYRKLFGLIKEFSAGEKILSKIAPINQIEISRLIDQLKLKGYSENTIRCYVTDFSQYLYFIKNKSALNCNETEVRAFLLYCINELQVKENTLHSHINGIKFYYEQVLRQEKIFLEIPRPKKELKLPKALNIEEVKRLFAVTKNLKHNTILKLCYGMGLRLSEIINLKISDIDSKSMQVFIERSKGKKDRYVNLPESILGQLREYYLAYRPKEYLFEGQYGGQYSSRSIQQIFKDAIRNARIIKRVGIHSLRHSYATHLLESGTDIRFIQELLGHNDIKTTLIYTHVTDKTIRKIISPLDML